MTCSMVVSYGEPVHGFNTAEGTIKLPSARAVQMLYLRFVFNSNLSRASRIAQAFKVQAASVQPKRSRPYR